jgi:predicted enzyme related to lactoylglutathione lyase
MPLRDSGGPAFGAVLTCAFADGRARTQAPTIVVRARPFTVAGGFDMVKGLGTVIYHVTDLNRAKAWYATAFQQKPYFDQPFYVGFNIAGYELGLDPNQTVTSAGRGGAVAYWRVAGIESAVEHFVTAGAVAVTPIQDVGEGIKVATVADPFGNLIGLIENPHFELPKA